jgi:hypothetical protein
MNTDNTPAFKINRMHTGFESYILSIHLCSSVQSVATVFAERSEATIFFLKFIQN